MAEGLGYIDRALRCSICLPEGNWSSTTISIIFGGCSNEMKPRLNVNKAEDHTND